VPGLRAIYTNARSPPGKGDAVCNLYSVTKSQQAIRDLVKAIRDLTGNMPPMLAIFPNGRAPVVRTAPDGVRELLMMRWGFAIPAATCRRLRLKVPATQMK
jgi:putative SOS response-associated peptidase YedK